MRTDIEFHGLDVRMDLDTNQVYGVRIMDEQALRDWLELHFTEDLFEASDEAAQLAYQQAWGVAQ